jgi:hypothetical protein
MAWDNKGDRTPATQGSCPLPVLVGVRERQPVPGAPRERPERVVVVVQGHADLLQVVAALGAGRRVADLLHRRQEEADQHLGLQTGRPRSESACPCGTGYQRQVASRTRAGT